MFPTWFRKVFDKYGLQKFIHTNGLTVVFRKKSGAESVTLGIGSRAGLVHHPLTHLNHHMVFKGATGKTGIDIKKEAVQLGDTFDAFTDLYSTLLFIRVSPEEKCIQRGFQLLATMIRNPSLENDALEKEKRVVIEEIRGWNEEPKRMLRQLMYQALYRRHPARDVILEDPRVTAAATREHLVEIHQKFYHAPQRIVIVAVGRFKPIKLLRMIEQRFGDLTKTIEDSFGVPEEEYAGKRTKSFLRRWHGKQAHVMFGFRAPLRYHSDYFPVRLLSAVLGEDLDSRLYTELREKTGLVFMRGPLNPATEYDCSPWHGVLRIYAPCDPKNLVVVKQIIRKELRKLTQKPVETGELKRNQDKLILQHALSLAGTKKHVCLLFAAEINGALEDFDNFSHQIRRVSAKDIRRVARKYCFSSKAVCAVLKPPKRSKKNKGI